MELPLSNINNHTRELASASAFSWIRVAVVGSASSDTPLRDTLAPLLLPWQRASPAALGSNNSHSWTYFSATCWITARNGAHHCHPLPFVVFGMSQYLSRHCRLSPHCYSLATLTAIPSPPTVYGIALTPNVDCRLI
jgi:hypothetical protein